jgi:8-oxo-dGTP pyrophosphatase MutT (NUDIX family)
VQREALEETGLQVELQRYLVAARARFLYEPYDVPWRTHIFLATTEDQELAPQDTEEIQAARWGTLPELSGPLRERLLATGRAFWRYRVALHDAAAEALSR